MTRSDRDRVLARWSRSGLSAAEFAPSVGVSPSTLYSWRHKARSSALGDGPEESSRSSPGFFELVSATGLAADHRESGLTLELPRGVTLRIDRDFETATLRRAVETLLPPA